MNKLLLGLAAVASTSLFAGVADAHVGYHPPGAWPYPRNYFLGVSAISTPVDTGFIRRWNRRDLGNPGWAITALRIQEIVPNTPAQWAGLQQGDILLKANGIRLYSIRDLHEAIRRSGGVLYLEKLDWQSLTPRTITVHLLAY